MPFVLVHMPFVLWSYVVCCGLVFPVAFYRNSAGASVFILTGLLHLSSVRDQNKSNSHIFHYIFQKMR